VALVSATMAGVQVTARIDYAVRALLELASRPDGQATRDELAESQEIPPRYLEMVLSQLRQAGLVTSRRGFSGGYRLARPAAQISVADVSRAVDGPLALVQGRRPEDLRYEGSSRNLSELWVGLRSALRSVLESVTLADLLAGDLPAHVKALADNPAAWRPR
jgi:Rrf2 family protein